ncbi:MAG: hypothetical protein ACRDGM_06605 [bacterium]
MSVKTYGWLSPEKLKFINETPQVLSLLYDLGLLPEEISTRVRGYVGAERERCAKVASNICDIVPTVPERRGVLMSFGGIIANEIRKS